MSDIRLKCNSLASRLNRDQLDINQITPERRDNRVF